MRKLWEYKCRIPRQLLVQPEPWRTGSTSPPPMALQLAMAQKIDAVLGHKYGVVPLPASDLHEQESFGIDKYKAVPPLAASTSTSSTLPNRYRLTGHELTVTGFAKFHAFDVTIYADPPAVDVVGVYPHRGPLCGVYKMVAFCEVGPQTEERLIVINETLNDALEGGAIAYVDDGTEEQEAEEEVWARDGGHNHPVMADEDSTGCVAEPGPSVLFSSRKNIRGRSWTKDGEHNHQPTQ